MAAVLSRHLAIRSSRSAGKFLPQVHSGEFECFGQPFLALPSSLGFAGGNFSHDRAIEAIVGYVCQDLYTLLCAVTGDQVLILGR